MGDVERASAGDADARDRVLVRFVPLARSTAVRLVPPGDVDDVVQSSLAEAIAMLPRLRVAAAFPASLRVIVRRQASLARRAATTPWLLDDVDPPADESASPHRRAEAADLARRVDAALRLLSADDPRLLQLRYLAGWSNQEIAGLLRISEAATRKRLFDARRRARPHLEPLQPKEAAMTDPRSLLGTVHDADVEVARPAELRRPADEPTTTGLKVIDTLAPIRRGGTVDLFGPYGTGHLVLSFEILQRVAGDRETAMVLVAGKDPDVLHFDPRAVVDDRSVPGPNTAILVDGPEDAGRAFAAGAALAAGLAHDGVEVVLVVADPVLAALDPAAIRAAAGLAINGAAVTAVAVRTTDRGADLPAALGLDATLVLSLEQFVLGIFPALDPTELRSIFEPSADGARARELLASARSLRAWFGQSLFVAADHTGEAGSWADPGESARELEHLLTTG